MAQSHKKPPHGTSGPWSVQRLGRLAVVQDPRGAQAPAMPTNALKLVAADYVVPLVELGALLVRLSAESALASRAFPLPSWICWKSSLLLPNKKTRWN